MNEYKWKTEDKTEGVIRYSDGFSIPNDRRNWDWKRYLKYTKAGGLTDPWKPLEQQKAEKVEAEAKEEWLKSLEVEKIASGFNGLGIQSVKSRIDTVIDGEKNDKGKWDAVKVILKELAVGQLG